MLKEKYPWTDVCSKIHEHYEERMRISFLGGGLVLIQPGSVEQIIDEDLKGISKWFDVIKPWDDEIVCNHRLIWTRWYKFLFKLGILNSLGWLHLSLARF